MAVEDSAVAASEEGEEGDSRSLVGSSGSWSPHAGIPLMHFEPDTCQECPITGASQASRPSLSSRKMRLANDPNILQKHHLDIGT